MRHFRIFCLASLFAASAIAQTSDENRPWQRKISSVEGAIKLHIDLYNESINVPGMDMFGPMNGYLGGNIYGVWMVTSFEIKDDREATLRLSNDLGSDTQECVLTQLTDSTFNLKLKGGVYVKKVVNKKLVKIPSEILFKLDK